MCEWTVELVRQDLLWLEFGRPVDIDPGPPEDIAVQLTEAGFSGVRLLCETIEISRLRTPRRLSRSWPSELRSKAFPSNLLGRNRDDKHYWLMPRLPLPDA